MEIKLSIISMVIAGFALFVSFKSYKINIPSIHIKFLQNPYYGATAIIDDKLTLFMACCDLRINNKSSKKVNLSEIYLLVNGEKYGLVNKDVEMHITKEFYFEDISHFTNEKYRTNNTYILYKENGLYNNISIDSFSSVDKTAIFFFPKSDKNKIKCKLVLDTPYRKFKRNVILLIHDENYDNGEWEQILKWEKTL